VDDVAHAFERALLTPRQCAEVYNLVGESVTVDEVISEIRRHVPDAQLNAQGPPLTIASGITEEGLHVLLPRAQRVSLSRGIASTVQYYLDERHRALSH
jgi:nucleoside-diphosphate-sugar epimerase